MGTHENGSDGQTPHDQWAETAEELERQARETLRLVQESAGDLGARVRQAVDYAASLWEASSAAPAEEHAPLAAPDLERGRALLRTWVARDFLVEPELPEAAQLTRLTEHAAWRVELRERGETRSIRTVAEPFAGGTAPTPGPVLPPWEYTLPTTPEIASGERRERLPGTALLGACLVCNGAGTRPCATCEGRAFLQCPVCHGRSRLVCTRCRGRGAIADDVAERRARAGKGYWQVHGERLATDAAQRLADLSELLRQDYGVPLPPSERWAPTAPASGKTLPCPDCQDGTVPCACGTGKVVCTVCSGAGRETCPDCGGSGRVLRLRELVRQFDTRATQRILPPGEQDELPWFRESMLRRVEGEEVWQGTPETIAETPPQGIPAHVWGALREMVTEAAQALATASTQPPEASAAERRVIARHLRLTRVPLVHVEYGYAEKEFAVVAAGVAGNERFWAEAFPPRWSRVGRFLKALARDLNGSESREHLPPSSVHDMEQYRARLGRRVRIEDDSQPAPEPPPPPDGAHD